MAKKWKTGVKYRLKDKAGFLEVCSLNHRIVREIKNYDFIVTKLHSDGCFSRIIVRGETMDLIYEIAKDERKFFKVVKEKKKKKIL